MAAPFDPIPTDERLAALGRLAAAIAHDQKNALMVLAAEVEALHGDLRTHGALTPERAASFESMELALAHAAGLAQRVLDAVRQRDGKVERVDLGESLRRMAPLLRRAAGPSVGFDLAIEPDVPPVRIDPVQFEQVALNLVVNARDAMPDGGKLTVRLAAPATGVDARDHVALTVRDTGVGMDEDVRQRIFAPFFTTKADGAGAGLGLATTRAIVASCGGVIDVVSAPGRGAEFRLTFPAAR